MDLQLDGKRAYVMAASSGLGRTVAEELVREGVPCGHFVSELRVRFAG
ncbi:hypothetical protein [Haladaptatus cibarius]|nr:hypothetical protein [Haladaptatus cibarius]